MTAVEKIIEYCKKQKNIDLNSHRGVYFNIIRFCEEQAKEMEKQEKIKILKSLVYSVCIGDDVEDVEEWLQKHELNKSK